MSSILYPFILKLEKFLVDFPHWQQTADFLQLKSTWSLNVVIQTDLIPCRNKYFSFNVFVFRYSNGAHRCGLNHKIEAWCLSWFFLKSLCQHLCTPQPASNSSFLKIFLTNNSSQNTERAMYIATTTLIALVK